MKWCLLLNLFLFLGMHSVKGAAVKEELEVKVDPLRTFLERKCLKNADADTFAKLDSTMQKFPVCQEDMQFAKTDEGLFNNMCTVRQGYKCLGYISDKIIPCLDTEEKHLKDFVLRSYNEALKYLCEGGVKSFKRKLLRLNEGSTSCTNLRKYFTMIDNPCMREINLELINDSDLVVTKTYFCSKLDEVGNCMIEGLRKKCTDEQFVDFMSEGMHKYLNWCTVNNSSNK